MDHSSEAASIKKEPVKLSVLLNLSAITLTCFVTRELKPCQDLVILPALNTDGRASCKSATPKSVFPVFLCTAGGSVHIPHSSPCLCDGSRTVRANWHYLPSPQSTHKHSERRRCHWDWMLFKVFLLLIVFFFICRFFMVCSPQMYFFYLKNAQHGELPYCHIIIVII